MGSNDLFQDLKPTLRAIAETLHGLLLEIEPDFEVRQAWNGVGYKLRQNYSCLIAGYDDHVKLMIWLGAALHAPEGVLRGRGQNTRHLRFDALADLDPPLIRRLLRQQLKLFGAGVSYEAPPQPRSATRTIPAPIRRALLAKDLLAAYRARPRYQQADYVSWITRAKREPTRHRRLEQMLAELEAGDVYMKMAWQPARRGKAASP